MATSSSARLRGSCRRPCRAVKGCLAVILEGDNGFVAFNMVLTLKTGIHCYRRLRRVHLAVNAKRGKFWSIHSCIALLSLQFQTTRSQACSETGSRGRQSAALRASDRTGDCSSSCLSDQVSSDLRALNPAKSSPSRLLCSSCWMCAQLTCCDELKAWRTVLLSAATAQHLVPASTQ